MEQVISTHRTSCQSGWPRGFSCLNPSPYFSLSGFQSSLLLIPENLYTLHQSVAQNLSDMWRSIFEIGAALFCSVTKTAPKSPFSCVNRITIRCMVFVAAQKLSCAVWTAIRYVTLHFRARRGAASLRHRNHAEITVLMCEQKPYPVCDFRAGATAILYSVNIALKYSTMFDL